MNPASARTKSRVLAKETVPNETEKIEAIDDQMLHGLDVIGYIAAMERALATFSSGARPAVCPGIRWPNGKKRLRKLSMRLLGAVFSIFLVLTACKKNPRGSRRPGSHSGAVRDARRCACQFEIRSHRALLPPI
jgi:hypothetical protein